MEYIGEDYIRCLNIRKLQTSSLKYTCHILVLIATHRFNPLLHLDKRIKLCMKLCFLIRIKRLGHVLILLVLPRYVYSRYSQFKVIQLTLQLSTSGGSYVRVDDSCAPALIDRMGVNGLANWCQQTFQLSG